MGFSASDIQLMLMEQERKFRGRQQAAIGVAGLEALIRADAAASAKKANDDETNLLLLLEDETQ